MKTILYSLVLSLVLIASSCTKRATIPDEELALIFRDAFLANAYVLNNNVQFDTLQIYQPIFDKYGYSAEDIAYTVGSFSRRKSARLSDVVERSIKMLEQGDSYYQKESTILDSIDIIARRRAVRTIYERDVIEYHKLKDSTNIIIEFDSIAPGTYDISFEYLVDTLDNNRSSYRMMSWFEEYDSDTKLGTSTTFLRKHSIESFDRRVEVDTMTHLFKLKLAESYEVKRTPHVTFRDLKITYTPPTAEAVETFYNDKLNSRLFADEFFGTKLQQADSLVVPTL
ncbi:MAG: DUF4296 domain-containing protein [Rikenellaceae bacterium]